MLIELPNLNRRIILFDSLPTAYLLDGGDDERCCIMQGHRHERTWTIDEFLIVPNRAYDTSQNFAVWRTDVVAVGSARVLLRNPHDGPRTPIGVLHSHPGHSSPEPSLNDLIGLPVGWIGGVVHETRVTWYINPRTRSIT